MIDGLRFTDAAYLTSRDRREQQGVLMRRSSRNAPTSAMIRLARVASVILSLQASAAPAAAQASAVQYELATFRDSILYGNLARPALDSLVRKLEFMAKAKERDANVWLHLGFAELRSSESGGSSKLADASRAFERAEALEPTWAFPLYGLGLVKLAESKQLAENPLELGARPGMGALMAAVELLRKALGLDPKFLPALTTLGRIGLSTPDSNIQVRTLEALRLAHSTRCRSNCSNPPPASLVLDLGRLERLAGNLKTSVALFETYLEMGEADGLALLELARTELAIGQSKGEADYYTGAASDDSVSVAGYRADLALIASDSILAVFDSSDGSVRVAFLHDFWANRDYLDLRRPGERLMEHYRRIQYAREHFTPDITRRAHWLQDLLEPINPVFDDRGVVYIRYGVPAIRLTPFVLYAQPNESWRYKRPDGDLILHFGADHAVDDFRLEPGLLSIHGRIDDVLHSRDSLDPLYNHWAMWGRHGQIRMARLDRRIATASAALAVSSDAYDLQFAHRLPVTLGAVSLGRTFDASLVHLVFAIPGEAATNMAIDGSGRFPVELRFVAFDDARRVVAAFDSSFVLQTARQAFSGEYIFGQIAFPVKPGSWTYRVALQQGDSCGVVFPERSINVPNLRTGPLSVSDLVVGYRQIPLTWTTGNRDTVYISPFDTYFQDSELELYYEVYGAVPDSRLRTSIEIGRGRASDISRNTRFAARLQFQAYVGSEGTVAGRHTIRLSQFAPGVYWIKLTVTDAKGREVNRYTSVEVEKRP